MMRDSDDLNSTRLPDKTHCDGEQYNHEELKKDLKGYCELRQSRRKRDLGKTGLQLVANTIWYAVSDLDKRLNEVEKIPKASSYSDLKRELEKCWRENSTHILNGNQSNGELGKIIAKHYWRLESLSPTQKKSLNDAIAGREMSLIV